MELNTDTIDFSRLSEWLLLDSISKRYKEYSIGQLKYWANNRHKNGLDKVCKKVGKNLYIYESGFLLWIKNKKDSAIKDKENSQEHRKRYMREYMKTARPNLKSTVEDFFEQDDNLTDDDILDLLN